MMTKTNISCPSSLLDASASAIMPQPEDDVALMRQVIAQDHEAFNVLYTRYAQRLRGYLIRFLGQSGLVDEVLNDVMLVMWQRASRFDFTAQLLPWLLGIARQKARKALARNSPLVAPSDSFNENDIDTPEETILRQEYHENIAHALNTLSPSHRDCARSPGAPGMFLSGNREEDQHPRKHRQDPGISRASQFGESYRCIGTWLLPFIAIT